MEATQLLGDIRSEIKRRALLQGGWSSGAGGQAGVEVTGLALLALRYSGRVSDQGRDFLLQMQNTNGSWPAFRGDDPEGCWTTSVAVIALLAHQPGREPVQRAIQWLLGNEGREAHWFWNLKFRFADRKVQFDPNKHGWPWIPGTVSWVIPTAFSLIALKQAFSCCQTQRVTERIRVGLEMLFDRACPDGGWNAGNGVVLGSPLKPHIDPTAIALLALTDRATHQTTRHALSWLRANVRQCSAPYSLAWASLAFTEHELEAFASCIDRLHQAIMSRATPVNIETLSVAAIALGIAEGEPNPFQTVMR